MPVRRALAATSERLRSAPATPRQPALRGRAIAIATCRAGRRRGFTLLEVMLAVTILGIVATTIYGTFSRTLRSKGLAEERMDVMRTGRSAVERMSEELASAFYPAPAVPGAVFRSLKTGTETVPLDAIVFSSLSTRSRGSS